jgi:hypothetical protein
MKANKKFEAYIMAIIEKYIPILLLQRHTFEVKAGVCDPESLFECLFQYPYLNAVIKYSKNAIRRWKTGEDMSTFIVHELSHCITDPMYSKAIQRYVSEREIRDEREQLTDVICNIVMKMGVPPGIKFGEDFKEDG